MGRLLAKVSSQSLGNMDDPICYIQGTTLLVAPIALLNSISCPG